MADLGRPCAALSRRAFLQLGGLVAAGMPFARPVQAGTVKPGGKAKSCILVYLLGGPPHLDMFDLKPDAPAEIRGPFKPIRTTLPGVHVCEYFPLLARLTDKYALVRSVSHPNNNHTPMIYYTLTGRPVLRPGVDNDVSPPSRTDHPHMGSVLAHFLQKDRSLPGYIALPELAVRSNVDNVRQPLLLRGGKAGFLGATLDPFAVNEDPRAPGAIPELLPPREVNLERFERRQALLDVMDSQAPRSPRIQNFSVLRETAVVLSGSPHASRMYALDSEPRSVRERYGLHRFGQSMLLARRLAEAGVPMISIHFNYMTKCDGWDTHGQNFRALQDELLPLVDQGLSALIEDLDQRGQLHQTLIASFGEFGRTPRINGNAGRDHWGHCSTTFLAGGGIRGGQVYGSSDQQAAYPKTDPVDPVDIQATMYHCMGLGGDLHLHDQLRRAWSLTTGRVIDRLVC